MGELFINGITAFAQNTGIARIFAATESSAIAFAGIDFGVILMILISFVLLYLAIVKGFEPLLLMPIAFGMLLTNMPGAGVFHGEFFTVKEVDYGMVLHKGGLLDLLYLGVCGKEGADYEDLGATEAFLLKKHFGILDPLAHLTFRVA